MSLRVRLFLLLSGLVAVLVAAQWWLVRTLARDLSTEVGHVAFSVGESVVTTFALTPTDEDPPTERALAEVAQHAGPPAPVVKETEIAIAEFGDRLEVVDHRVRIMATPKVAAVEDGAGETTAIVLSVDSPHDARFLELTGPRLDRKIPIPRSGVSQVTDAFLQHLFAGSVGMLALGLVLAAFIAHRAAAPLRELASAARSVGEGALGVQVPARAGGEVGEAIASFNRMSSRLEQLDRESRALREREHLTEIGEIARGLAHGLRNPLNALGLSIDELADESSEPSSPRLEIAAAARRQIRRMDHAIRAFLALATDGKGSGATDVDVAALANDVVLEVLQGGRSDVKVDVQAPGSAVVQGVPAELRAVVQALVVNAVEASPAGGRVAMRVGADESGVRVEVEDDGAGLSEDVRGRLFTPHVTTKPTGSGMGLFLAHRIVMTRHGGTIELRARAPRGTTAIVTLPARQERAHG